MTDDYTDIVDATPEQLRARADAIDEEERHAAALAANEETPEQQLLREQRQLAWAAPALQIKQLKEQRAKLTSVLDETADVSSEALTDAQMKERNAAQLLVLGIDNRLANLPHEDFLTVPDEQLGQFNKGNYVEGSGGTLYEDAQSRVVEARAALDAHIAAYNLDNLWGSEKDVRARERTALDRAYLDAFGQESAIKNEAGLRSSYKVRDGQVDADARQYANQWYAQQDELALARAKAEMNSGDISVQDYEYLRVELMTPPSQRPGYKQVFDQAVVYAKAEWAQAMQEREQRSARG